MHANMRQRAKEERGFTLIELLVVILVIGILAAIAIPSLLSQKGKANDASAKELAWTAHTAAEAVSTDHNGDYATVSTATLKALEPTINTTAGTTTSYLSAATPTGGGTGYSVTAVSEPTGDNFTITRDATGILTRSCTVSGGGGTGGGCVNNSW